METRLHNTYKYWMEQIRHSTTEREYLYSCGRVDTALDLLRELYGTGSIEYNALRNNARTVQAVIAHRLGLQ